MPNLAGCHGIEHVISFGISGDVYYMLCQFIPLTLSLHLPNEINDDIILFMQNAINLWVPNELQVLQGIINNHVQIALHHMFIHLCRPHDFGHHLISCPMDMHNASEMEYLKFQK